MKGCSWMAGWLAFALASTAAGAAPGKVRFSDLAPLLQSGRPSARAAARATAGVPLRGLESPAFTQTEDGHIKSLRAAPGMEFPVAGGPAGSPEGVARNFLKQHERILGVASPAVDFKVRKQNQGPGRHSIRLTQNYGGIPVFGGELLVQVNDEGGVEYVSGNFDRDTRDLDEKRLSTKTKLTADEAAAAARAYYAADASGQPLTVTPPALTLFVPTLLKLGGPKRLTWKMDVRSADEITVARRVFIDAHSGEFVQDLLLNHDLRTRVVSDAELRYTIPGTTVRTEGDLPSGIADADAAYDFLGDTYNFYFDHFQRDGIDNQGGPLNATVRFRFDENEPYVNAFWSGYLSRMVFGEGLVADDVTAHEMTHGVTESESGLIYLNESGALDESIADIFGEFVDLTNSDGNDAPAVRWGLGEDIPGGPIRSMSNPASYGHPDWLGSGFYRAPVAVGTSANDYGGVHYNSGVNNKLCYLLTDGQRFRQQTIVGMGIPLVAALYYEANVNLLISSSGWSDLASALQQAAVNLQWTQAQRQNLDNALAAVGILTPRPLLYIDETSLGVELGTPESPVHSIPTAVSVLGASANGTFFIRGTAHSTRISRPVTLRPWDGVARVAGP